MLGQIMNMAEKAGVLSDDDFMRLSEREVMEKLNRHCGAQPKQAIAEDKLSRYYRTFRTMTKIEHTNQPLPESDYFCVNLKVKQRYINPLVVVECPRSGCIETTVKSKRLSEVSEKARRIIDDFKTFSDTAYGCVKLC